MRKALRVLLLAAAGGVLIVFCGCGRTQGQDREARDGSGRRAIQDAYITARIKTALLFNRHLNSFRIDVDTDDGRVTLAGVVPTDIQRDLAGEIARNAEGVRKVANELQVTEGKVEDPDDVDRTFSQAVLDATTTASVKMALAAARGVKASEIHVTTRWGTVTLAGAVGTPAERELAAKVAEDAGGVLEVVNKIEVRG